MIIFTKESSSGTFASALITNHTNDAKCVTLLARAASVDTFVSGDSVWIELNTPRTVSTKYVELLPDSTQEGSAQLSLLLLPGEVASFLFAGATAARAVLVAEVLEPMAAVAANTWVLL